MGKDKKIKKKRKKRESEGECKKPRLDSSSAEGQECSRKNDHSGTCNNAERKREGSSSIAQVDQPDRSATVCEVSTLYSRSDSTCDDTVECQREDGNGTGSNKLKKTITYHSSQIGINIVTSEGFTSIQVRVSIKNQKVEQYRTFFEGYTVELI